MITFVQSSLALVMVKLEGKHVGNILPYPGGGFHYVPIGSRNVGGEVHKTIAEVKRTLAEDDDELPV